MSGLRITLLAGVVGLALLCAGVASARQDAFDTRITIHEPSDFSYRGRVFSDLTACVRKREIELWRRQSGPDMLINTFNANRQGKWRYQFVGQHYYVVATRAKVGPHNKICREDRSPTT